LGSRKIYHCGIWGSYNGITDESQLLKYESFGVSRGDCCSCLQVKISEIFTVEAIFPLTENINKAYSRLIAKHFRVNLGFKKRIQSERKFSYAKSNKLSDRLWKS
jgi:hypothetical protein